MDKIDLLQDILQDEIMMQKMYNQYLIDITQPETRQLFTQLRDNKMKNLTWLQQEIMNLKNKK